jgi:hypothetical protein
VLLLPHFLVALLVSCFSGLNCVESVGRAGLFRHFALLHRLKTFLTFIAAGTFPAENAVAYSAESKVLLL